MIDRRRPREAVPTPTPHADAMPDAPSHCPQVGAVSYLNSKPLVEGLTERLAGGLTLDYPSRLAASLAAGDLDVALIPSVEVLRAEGEYEVVSDACVAARGPVRSVKVYFRVPPGEVTTLALDEGSRTSATLARVLLGYKYGVDPATESLPLPNGWPGRSDGGDASGRRRSGAEEPSERTTSAPDRPDFSARDDSRRPRHPHRAVFDAIVSTNADAILLIGDRAMFPVAEQFTTVWDLGEEWMNWTGLPFVFAVWAGRRGDVPDGLAELLSDARDQGVAALRSIADREAAMLGLDPTVAHDYLANNLHFRLGPAEKSGLKLFSQLAHQAGLAPEGIDLVFRDRTDGFSRNERKPPAAIPPVGAKRRRFARAR